MAHRQNRIAENLVLLIVCLSLAGLACAMPKTLSAQSGGFHDAPATASQIKNPVAGKADAAQAGANLYAKKCALCHGDKGQGLANIPAVSKNPTQSATDGAIFWFITKGSTANGMPAWSSLSADERWQIVAYIRSLGTGKAPQAVRHPPRHLPTTASRSPVRATRSRWQIFPNRMLRSRRAMDPESLPGLRTRGLTLPPGSASSNSRPDSTILASSSPRLMEIFSSLNPIPATSRYFAELAHRAKRNRLNLLLPV